MAIRITKRPRWTVSVDRVGGQGCKVEDNDIPSGSNYIGDVGRGILPVKYREGRNLPRAAEEKKTPCPDCRV